MNQKTQQFDAFHIIGIAVETTNANGQAAQDMGALWGQFFAQQIANQISTKLSDDIYMVYTDFESDYTGRYTAIIGHKVLTLNSIPEGLIGRTFPTGKYQHFEAKGAMPEAVGTAWQQIWEQDKSLNRAYIADFDVYGSKSQNEDKSLVDIYVGVR